MSHQPLYIREKQYCSSCREKRPEVVVNVVDRPICYQCLMKRLESLENLYTTLLRGRAELEVHRGNKKA